MYNVLNVAYAQLRKYYHLINQNLCNVCKNTRVVDY